MLPNAFTPSRLSLARRRRGWTKKRLAEAVGVSTRMAVAYEAGEKEPSRATLTGIARELRFPLEFFAGPELEEPPLDGSSFRALTRFSAHQREQSLAAGALALSLSDWISGRFTLPDPDVPRYQAVDPETAAMGVRTQWGLGERPISNVIHLLEARGVRIFSLAEDCQAMDAYSFWRGDLPFVFLNTMKSAERSRMDAAHELGHLVLHWQGGPRGRKDEQEAEHFASAFLMPEGSVKEEAPRGGLQRLIDAKKRWNVSLVSLIYRLHTLKLISDWQYRTLFIEVSRNNFHRNEPNASPREMSQVLAKVFKALREEGMTTTDMARELNVLPEELNKFIFGLVLTPVAA